MSAIRVGTYVTHSMRPAWGVGKVFGQSQQHILVGFAGLPEEERFKRMEMRPGLLEHSAVTNDAELDSWKVECDSTCRPILATVRAKRSTAKAALWTREQGMEKFLNKYNGGFPDAWYRASHRDPRTKQHVMWNELLGGGKLRQLAQDQPHIAAQHMLKILDLPDKPLLHAKTELPRLRDAFMRTERMPALLIALADLLDADVMTTELYDAYLTAFAALTPPGQKSAMSWPIVTVFPYIARPDNHMFLKPASMRNAAAGLGADIKFKSAPNAQTYERTLVFGKSLLEFIQPRSGVDMIDVQAFIGALVE
jgi:hypothetical protein